MNKKLLLWAITSALAGFLFGFDTVVISGAESKIQQLWSLSGTAHGLAISAALWGTVLGAFFGSIPTAKYGRRLTLIANGILFLIGAIGSCVAWDVYSFFIFRFIGGIGIGISTIAAPLFISEISPAGDRGKLTGLFQFNIVFGILMAFFSNFAINHLVSEEFAWRWMLGIQVVPSLLYTLMCLSLPESPRYLIVNKKDYEQGRKVFSLINPNMDNDELDRLVESVKEDSESTAKTKESSASFFTRKLKYPILFAFLIAAFNQLSGINIILYFAPRLLGLAGLEDPVAASIALGVTNLIATFIGIRLIDVLGRRTLLLIGCVGYILSLGVCTFAFFNYDELKVVSVSMDTASAASQIQRMENGDVYFTAEDLTKTKETFAKAKSDLLNLAKTQNITPSQGLAVFDGDDVETIKNAALELKSISSDSLGNVSATVLICMIVFIASHAIGSGTIIWVFISEIFPNEFRAKGQALGSFTHWIFAAGLTLVFPIAIATFDAGFMFGFFTLMMIIQLVFALIMMPETKGRSLEEIAKTLSSR